MHLALNLGNTGQYRGEPPLLVSDPVKLQAPFRKRKEPSGFGSVTYSDRHLPLASAQSRFVNEQSRLQCLEGLQSARNMGSKPILSFARGRLVVKDTGAIFTLQV